MKLKLPTFRTKKEFPNQFFAVDFGGKIVKIFVLNVSDGSYSALGSRRLNTGEENFEEQFKELVAELRAEFPEAEPLVVVGASGPETTAFTTVVRGAPGHGIEDLAKHAQNTAEESAREELSLSLGDPKMGVTGLESEILEVKEADKLEVFIFSSFATSSYQDERAQMVKRAGLELWGFSSLPFNLITDLAKEAREEELNCLIFDVGGAKTEISLVFGGQLMETKSFWWDFVENGNPTAFLDLWLEAVSFTLSDFEGVELFPPKIYLAGGASAFPGLEEVVTSFPWSRDHPFDVAPEV
ncbi:MAG: hypothetical protein WEC39_00110, partial [Patescibacteria group bacterium]